MRILPIALSMLGFTLFQCAPMPNAGGDAASDTVSPNPFDSGGVVPGDPAMRTSAQVCGRWNADLAQSQGVPAWVAGAMCQPGTLAQSSVDAAIRMTNTYRWLSGLEPVSNSAAFTTSAQACAVLMAENRMLNHTPPMTWTCWTAAGAEGASKSNITSGGTNPVRSIDRWIDDSGDITMTLGHRRWMLFPRLGPIGYGEANSYACLYVLGPRSNATPKAWVAWPNEGPTPSEVTPAIWSFSSSTLGVTASTRARVTAGGTDLNVSAMLRANGYGDPTISWNMPAVMPGTRYDVTITGLSGADVTYSVSPVRCGP